MTTKTKTKPIAKPQAKILPISDMHVSKLNMRHGKKAPNIDDIYPSILTDGVHQSLLVRKEGKGWGVIAGRRRLFALKRKAKQTSRPVSAPCVIMQSGNAKAARQASLLENIARLPATQLEQFAAFKALSDSGKTSEEIATVFNIKPRRVKQVLALASLKDEILVLYEAEDIDGRTLQALTLASDEQQAAWLDIFHGDEYAPQGEQLKAWLTGGARIKTDAALFDLEEFGGTIIHDLFGDTDYFQDLDLFWEHQNRAIAALADNYGEQGWSEVVILERGQRLDTYEFGQRSLEQGGKVFLSTSHDGSLKAYEGYLDKKDIKRIDTILNIGDAARAKPKASKPEMSGPMSQYVALHRHGAIRASLLADPSAALRLTVAHMLVGSHLWKVEPQGTKTRKDAVTQSVANAKGTATFEAERKWMHELFAVKAPQQHYSPTKKLVDGDIVELFAILLELDDATVMRVMTIAMAESLEAGSAIVEAIPYAVPVDMAALRKPDDAFFELLRDKTVINAMVKDIAGKSCADGAITDTGKAQKQIIKNRMAGHGTKTPRLDWRPRWMKTYAEHYIDRATCSPAQAGHTIQERMVKSDKALAA